MVIRPSPPSCTLPLIVTEPEVDNATLVTVPELTMLPELTDPAVKGPVDTEADVSAELVLKLDAVTDPLADKEPTAAVAAVIPPEVLSPPALTVPVAKILVPVNVPAELMPPAPTDSVVAATVLAVAAPAVDSEPTRAAPVTLKVLEASAPTAVVVFAISEPKTMELADRPTRKTP